jgi:tetratricopeptide (TPR) repeat protein
VFNAIGRLAREVNQESLGPVYHTHALEIARAIGDTPNIIMALSMSSSQMLGLQLIDYPTALAMLEEALSLSRATNDQKGLAAALNDLGEITRFAGELERAEAYYAEGAEVARASGNMYGANVGTANRGFVALKLSKYAEARTLFSSVLIQTRVVAGDMPSAVCLLGMAGVAVHEQQAERAAILLGAMQGILDAKRFYLHPNENVDFHDISAALHAQLSPAAYEAAWAQGYQMGPEKALIYALGSGSQ